MPSLRVVGKWVGIGCGGVLATFVVAVVVLTVLAGRLPDTPDTASAKAVATATARLASRPATATPAPGTTGAASAPPIDDQIKILIDGRVVTKVEFHPRVIWVNPVAWAVADAEQKKMVTSVGARYIARSLGSSTMFCDVMDSQSGRKLAELSTFSGFSVEQ